VTFTTSSTSPTTRCSPSTRAWIHHGPFGGHLSQLRRRSTASLIQDDGGDAPASEIGLRYDNFRRDRAQKRLSTLAYSPGNIAVARLVTPEQLRADNRSFAAAAGSRVGSDRRRHMGRARGAPASSTPHLEQLHGNTPLQYAVLAAGEPFGALGAETARSTASRSPRTRPSGGRSTSATAPPRSGPPAPIAQDLKVPSLPCSRRARRLPATGGGGQLRRTAGRKLLIRND